MLRDEQHYSKGLGMRTVGDRIRKVVGELRGHFPRPHAPLALEVLIEALIGVEQPQILIPQP